MPSSVLSQLCLHKVCLLLLEAAELAEEELESGTGIKHGRVGFFLKSQIKPLFIYLSVNLLVKFIYSEKATKICPIIHILFDITN